MRFGSNLSADETAYNALFVKRYGAVNGQVLPPPDKHSTLDAGSVFAAPNKIIAATTQNLSAQFRAGDEVLVELANRQLSTQAVVADAGRNLLLRTSDWGGNWGFFGAGVYHSISDGVITIGSQQDSWKHVASVNQSSRLALMMQIGQTYTLSVYARSTDGTRSVRIIIRDHINGGGHRDNIVATQTIGTNWTRIIATGVYQHTDNRSNVQIVLEQANGVGSVQFRQPKLEVGAVATPYSQAPEDASYNFDGVYTIAAVDGNTITLQNPEIVASDWGLLAQRNDTAQASGAVLSTEETTLWQGWFYTDLPDHDDVIVNIKAPNGIYTSYGDQWSALRIHVEIQSELVGDDGTAVANTRHTRHAYIESPSYTKYLDAQGRAWVRTTDDDVRRTAAATIKISNPSFRSGKKMRWRIRRSSRSVYSNKGQVLQEIKVVDCYGVRHMTERDTPDNVTLVSTKTLATEGALSLKERKLKLLVQRKLNSPDGELLSNRADDIIYHIAKDNGLTDEQINLSQIKSEIDRLIEYFGTDKCAEFCGTFDNTNITTEEMIQTVAQAVFSQAYRLNNQVHLHFERPQSHSMVGFNSHNILPDSYSYSESFGARNDHDGVQVTYSDPVDDAKITLSYPDGATNPQKSDLLGVRNKVQAHIHMMRLHHKNQYAYKTCELTGADESGVVIPTNRIDVANQLRSDTVQGSVYGLDSVDGEVLMSVSEPVALADSQTATVFVQTTAGILDNIKCTKHDDYTLRLSRMPSAPISVDGVVRAVYTLVTHSDTTKDSYIVTKKDVGDNPMTHKLTCINYTDKYYQNDSDFKKGLISL